MNNIDKNILTQEPFKFILKFRVQMSTVDLKSELNLMRKLLIIYLDTMKGKAGL